jgi:hypothetical protein
MMSRRFRSFSEFYPFYLSEHSDPRCRRLHFIGIVLALVVTVSAVFLQTWSFLLAAPVAGYGCAWAGHFFCEGNRPATFRHPLYSFVGDWVMFKDILVGKIGM